MNQNFINDRPDDFSISFFCFVAFVFVSMWVFQSLQKFSVHADDDDFTQTWGTHLVLHLLVLITLPWKVYVTIKNPCMIKRNFGGDPLFLVLKSSVMPSLVHRWSHYKKTEPSHPFDYCSINDDVFEGS